MKKAGQVIFVSRNQGMLVVQHDDGFAVVELLGSEGEIDVGSQVQGDWSANGSEALVANDQPYDAYFQGNWAGRDAAIRKARDIGGG